LEASVNDLLAAHVAAAGTIHPEVDGRLTLQGDLPRET
jgi:hypothetical protein